MEYSQEGGTAIFLNYKDKKLRAKDGAVGGKKETVALMILLSHCTPGPTICEKETPIFLSHCFLVSVTCNQTQFLIDKNIHAF